MLEMKEFELDFVKESVSFYELINEEANPNKDKKSILEKLKKMLLKIKNFFVNIYKKFKKFIVNLFNKITGYAKKEEAYIAAIDKLKNENAVNHNIYSYEMDQMKKVIEKKEKELKAKEREIKKKDSIINDLEKSRKQLSDLKDHYEKVLDKNIEKEKKELDDKIISKRKALSEIKLKEGYEGIVGGGDLGLSKQLYALYEIKYLFTGLKDQADINSTEDRIKRNIEPIDRSISEYKNYKSSLKTIAANEVINEDNSKNIKYNSMEKIDRFTNKLKVFSKDLDKIYKEIEKELNDNLGNLEFAIKKVNEPNSVIDKDDINDIKKFIASDRKKITYINFLNTEISYIIPTIITERKNILNAVKLGMEIKNLKDKLDLIK